MTIYNFYYNNIPYCLIDSKEYKKTRALYRLKMLDDLDYNKIIIGKNKLKLISNNTMVIINNLNSYMKSKDLQRCFEYNYPIIKQELKKLHATNKPVKNTSLNAKKIIAGSLTLSMLLATYKTKDINQINISNYDLKESTNIEQDNKAIINELEESIINEVVEKNQDVSISFDNLSESEKALYVQQTYGELINQYSNKWGVDPRIITAILTQESGGKDTNLMQIEYNAWKDQVITAKNFNDNSNVKIVLTDNPEEYDSSILTINKNELNNPKTNISVGTILLTYNLKNFNYNIPIALTSYNCGIGTMNKILDEASKNIGYTKKELIDDPTNLEFLNYRFIMQNGDPNYFENVIRYIPNYKEDDIKVFDNNNEIHILNIAFNNKTK